MKNEAPHRRCPKAFSNCPRAAQPAPSLPAPSKSPIVATISVSPHTIFLTPCLIAFSLDSIRLNLPIVQPESTLVKPQASLENRKWRSQFARTHPQRSHGCPARTCEDWPNLAQLFSQMKKFQPRTLCKPPWLCQRQLCGSTMLLSMRYRKSIRFRPLHSIHGPPPFCRHHQPGQAARLPHSRRDLFGRSRPRTRTRRHSDPRRGRRHLRR